MTSRVRAVLAVSVLALLIGGVSLYTVLTDEITGTVRSTESSEFESVPMEGPDGGTYAFMSTQPGTDDVPVTYDPCQTIRIVVNPDRAPRNADEILDDALERMEETTGLQFQVDGTTDADPLSTEVGDAGDRPPVQISWSDAQTVPDLEGDVAGLGGSTWVEEDGFRQYVTGIVVLDADDLDDLGEDVTRTVLLHELGHLVGLAHVDDRDELMHPYGDLPDWGPGDLAGLAALGGTCD